MSKSPPRSSEYPLISVKAAVDTIISNLSALAPELLSPSRCLLGRVIAEDVLAPNPVPSFRASVKDGYAVASSSVYSENTAFRVVESISAGKSLNTLKEIRAGECAYITTGAPLPPGADAVIMVEDSRTANGDKDESVTFAKWVSGPGDDVRQVGVDIQEGQVILRKGDTVGAAEIGLLIGCGVRTVEVHPRVRIGVMSTGDEIVDSAEALASLEELRELGKIVDSNRPMLLALIDEYLPFCDCIDLGIVQDRYETLKTALVKGSQECDILVTSGGVSMGNRDFVKPLLKELGTVHFGRVLMKPGKPLTFSTFAGRNACAIGLPGNPVSAFVCFHLAVTVASKILAGWSKHDALSTMIDVYLDNDIKLDPQRPEYHRVTVEWKDGCYRARSTGEQASSRLISARSANALLILPAARVTIPAESKAQAILVAIPRGEYVRYA